MITATNRFITEPIAARFGVDYLLATEAEMRNGRYTGHSTGTPCFQRGKVERLEQWLATENEDLIDSWFYSDSHNDLPLFERVAKPVAVDPDEMLRREAQARNWAIISLRTQMQGESQEL